MEKNDLIAAYQRVFSTPEGETVLADLEDRANRLIRIDQYPTAGNPNPAYLNPNASLYKQGQLDVVQRIKRILKKQETYNDGEEHYDSKQIIENLRGNRKRGN